MKKKIVGHMTASKERGVSRFRRLHLFSRLVCLLLALTIWLLLYHLSPNSTENAVGNTAVEQEERVQ